MREVIAQLRHEKCQKKINWWQMLPPYEKEHEWFEVWPCNSMIIDAHTRPICRPFIWRILVLYFLFLQRYPYTKISSHVSNFFLWIFSYFIPSCAIFFVTIHLRARFICQTKRYIIMIIWHHYLLDSIHFLRSQYYPGEQVQSQIELSRGKKIQKMSRHARWSKIASTLLIMSWK